MILSRINDLMKKTSHLFIHLYFIDATPQGYINTGTYTLATGDKTYVCYNSNATSTLKTNYITYKYTI